MAREEGCVCARGGKEGAGWEEAGAAETVDTACTMSLSEDLVLEGAADSDVNVGTEEGSGADT